MRSLGSILALVASLALTACSTDRSGVRPGGGFDGAVDDDAGLAEGDDGGLPLPTGDDGGAPISCPTGSHASGNGCLPDEVTCAAEFPCPVGQQCVGGTCVARPGPCATNDDCPAGFACVNGTCAPACPNNPQCVIDADCKMGQLCVACNCVSINQCAKPTPDLSGKAWAADQHLHLDEALGAFGKSFAGIMKSLRDGVLHCPAGSGANCFLFQIIASFLPTWAQNLIVGIGNFADLLDNHDFHVTSTMTFKHNGKPSGYDGTDHWTLLSFSYMNQKIQAKPENVPQIGQPVILNFQASAVCGVLYVDKHKVEGVLSGILKWIIDTIVQLQTCPNNGPCYMSLADAVDAAIDCSQVQGNLAALAACQGFKLGLHNKIDQALNAWLLDYALMTLKGTALVNASGHSLDKGLWDGTLGNGNTIFKNFTGEWSAAR